MRWAAGWALVGLIALEQTALAKPARLAIVARVISRPGVELELDQAGLFEVLAKSAAFARELEVLPWATMSAAPIDDALRRCGSGVDCMATLLRERARADLALWVVADLGAPARLLSVRLVDCDASRVIAQEINELSARDAELAPPITQAVLAVLGEAGHAAGGRLVVEVDPPGAELSVGAGLAPDGESKHSYWVGLDEGRTRRVVHVGARLAGHEDAALEAEVESGKETRVALVLEREQSPLASPWLWVGAALAVAAGVTAVAMVSRSGERGLCMVRDLSQPCD